MKIKKLEPGDIIARPDQAAATGSVLHVAVVDIVRGGQLCLFPLASVTQQLLQERFESKLSKALYPRPYPDSTYCVVGEMMPDGSVVLNEPNKE